MNWAFSILLLFIILDCVTNVNSLTLKWCHVPLTAFYRPVKAVDIPYPKECNKSALKRHNITENRYFTFNIVNKPSENLHQWTCMSKTWWLKSRKYINNIHKLQTRRNYKQHCYCFSLNKHLVIFKERSTNFFTGNCCSKDKPVINFLEQFLWYELIVCAVYPIPDPWPIACGTS